MGPVVEVRGEANIPRMAKQINKGMADDERLVRLFGSTSRPRILGLLLADTGKAFYQREVMYETGLSLLLDLRIFLKTNRVVLSCLPAGRSVKAADSCKADFGVPISE